MNLSEPFIRRPVMTVLLTLTVVLFGVMAFLQLPVSDLPTVDYPTIQVNVSYPGADPETMASTVTTPLERQFMQISGIELITSQSSQSSASITLQFNLDRNIDAAANDVQSAITKATGQLPADLPTPPVYTKVNPNDSPIFYIGLISDTMTQGQIYDYAKTQVGQQINVLPGVSRVDVYGAQAAVRVQVDPLRLASRGISMKELAAAIQKGTTYQGAGQFDGESKTFLLKPEGQLQTAKEYEALIIALRAGLPVYLRDVASVKDSVVDERIQMHFNAKGYKTDGASVLVAVSKSAGANVIAVSKSVWGLMPMFKKQLPGSITMVPIYDRSKTIMESSNDVKETLIISFVLVVLVIFVFLGRASDTVIPAVALPLSLLMTFIPMKWLGYSLDNLSLMALTLAIGFLVDDAIVFLENTVRRMENGEDAWSATLHGAKEISFTILSMTLSLAAVFIPIAFMPGMMGRIFREFAVVIMIAIGASGIVSLSLTPLMCSRMLHHRHEDKKTWMERLFNSFFEPIRSAYGRSLHFFLEHKWISVWVWILSFVGTLWFVMLVPKTFLPIGDSSFIRGVLIAPQGTSPDKMVRLQNQVDATLKNDPQVKMSLTVTGLSRFLPSTYGFVLIFLDKPGTRPPIMAMSQMLRQKLAMVPGALAFIRPEPVLQISTSGVRKDQGQYAFSISGGDASEVYKATGAMLQEIRSIKGVVGASTDMFLNTPQLKIEILREAASTYGVSAEEIESVIRNAYSQNYIYLIKKSLDQYQVILETTEETRERVKDLGLLYVRSDKGGLVPLRAVARWNETVGPQTVNHVNQFTSTTIFFDLLAGVPIGDVTKKIDAAAAKVVPSTVFAQLRGDAEQFKKTVKSLMILLVFAVIAMYIILGILYEHYLHPVTVLSSLPVAAVGGLATLLVFGMEFSLYAFVGMFMLLGIVKKNGIMMVDFALQQIDRGKDRLNAVHEASIERFRPIMMTTVAALVGAIPLACGYGADGASRQPLGLIIVGGLIFSQVITLYVTPVVFLYMETFQEEVLDKYPFFRASRAAADDPAHK